MSDGHAVGRVAAALVAVFLLVASVGRESADTPATSGTAVPPSDARLEQALLTEADPPDGVEAVRVEDTFASDYVVVRNGDLLTTLLTTGVGHDTTRAIVDAAQVRIETLDG